MNDDIVPLPNGDFTVITKAMKEKDEFERKIKEAMGIPTPLLRFEVLKGREPDSGQVELYFDLEADCPLCEMGVPLSKPKRHIELDDFEKHLPGVQESDFAGVMMSAPPGIADDMPDYDLEWAIVKLNEGKEYFLKKMNDDGTREWTRDNTVCRLWQTEHEATQFGTRHLEPGKFGVRGLLTGG